ncbi:MAG TPA: hypothetical protein VIY72_02095 [Acidimicrobiales bacterium]
MRKLIVLVLVITLVVAGLLAGQALYAWEWSRAVWMTVGFVAVEVALVGVLVLGRLKDLGARLEAERDRDLIRHRLVGTRPAPNDHFAWLRESMGRTNVFVTMLIGGGVIISGALWLIDQVARRSVTSSNREGRLADDLRSIAPPRDGLVPPEGVLFAEDLSSGERDDLWLLLTGRHGPRPGP